MFEIPIEAFPVEKWTPREKTGKILIIGSAGVVAEPLIKSLKNQYSLIGIDVVEQDEKNGITNYVGDSNDVEILEPLVSEVDYVILLATGVYGGWDGLMKTEINGTKLLLELAMKYNVHRVILASSNHTTGWYERMAIKNGYHETVHPETAARADGLYGISKSFAENIAQFASDWYGLPVSILRLGTLRRNMTLEELIDSNELEYLGNGDFRKDRLNRSWLSFEDLVKIVDEELLSSQTFRLRFATSSPEQKEWNHRILSRD